MEAEFLRQLDRWVRDIAVIDQQVKVGKYRVDFGIGETGIEIDGKKYHNAARDMVRDSEIVSGGRFKQVIRIQAAAFWWHESAVRFAVSNWCRELKEFDSVQVINENRLEKIGEALKAGGVSLHELDTCSAVRLTNNFHAEIGSTAAFLKLENSRSWTGLVTRTIRQTR